MGTVRGRMSNLNRTVEARKLSWNVMLLNLRPLNPKLQTGNLASSRQSKPKDGIPTPDSHGYLQLQPEGKAPALMGLGLSGPQSKTMSVEVFAEYLRIRRKKKRPARTFQKYEFWVWDLG